MNSNLVLVAVSPRIVLLFWSISLITLKNFILRADSTQSLSDYTNKSLVVSCFLCQDNPSLAFRIPNQFRCCVNNSCLLIFLYVLLKPVFKIITIIKHTQVFYSNQVHLIQNRYFKSSNTSFQKNPFQRF